MIQYEEALNIIFAESPSLSAKRIRLQYALDHVLAETVIAPINSPLFDNSAVDGFGVLLKDLQNAALDSPAVLTIKATIQAGDDPKQLILKPGETIKILTGAPVPSSVEAVIMREFCTESFQDNDSQITVQKSVAHGENIRRKGEEFQVGKKLLDAGTLITPTVIGLLASLGLSSVQVIRKPTIGIIVTGNELVQPGHPLPKGKIYESNALMIAAALKELGICQYKIYHAKDTVQSTRLAFQRALKNHDTVISIGGISVGDYDFVKHVSESLGIHTRFWGIALKPGKPVYFGTYRSHPKQARQKLCFGLPGNPVSAMVTFHQLVRPTLLQQMGMGPSSRTRLTATLTQSLRKKPGRLEWVRGILEWHENGFTVTPTVGQDSHMLHGLAQANGLIEFPLELSSLEQGQVVSVEPMFWESWPLPQLLSKQPIKETLCV